MTPNCGLPLLPLSFLRSAPLGWTFTVLFSTIATPPTWAQTEPVVAQQEHTVVEPATEGFNWTGALVQSGLLLGVQHSLRMVQGKTREKLGGPFWRDYVESVKGLEGWDDRNPVATNYLGHPLLGGITGFIQIQNDPRGMSLEWSPGEPEYWKSRSKALAWAAAYSTSFELAPWGEAGIGNVGYDPNTMAWVDLVITPLAGFGWILMEDYLDKAVIRRLEAQGVTTKARIMRVVLNPGRSVANLMRFKRPSHRDTR